MSCNARYFQEQLKITSGLACNTGNCLSHERVLETVWSKNKKERGFLPNSYGECNEEQE
jgi:hypothetical protein